VIFSKKLDELPAADQSSGPPPLNTTPSLASASPPLKHGGPVRSVVDGWLRITGDLEGDGELEIEGHVVGNVRCKQLVVGSKAVVDGNITADQVVIRGKVNGVIRANYVMLQHGARVDSEIFHKELAIEAGAQFEGSSRHREDPTNELKAVAAEMKAAVQLNGASKGQEAQALAASA
jgi:cytoskeletal protein CcmA (bactofilin family)